VAKDQLIDSLKLENSKWRQHAQAAAAQSQAPGAGASNSTTPATPSAAGAANGKKTVNKVASFLSSTIQSTAESLSHTLANTLTDESDGHSNTFALLRSESLRYQAEVSELRAQLESCHGTIHNQTVQLEASAANVENLTKSLAEYQAQLQKHSSYLANVIQLASSGQQSAGAADLAVVNALKMQGLMAKALKEKDIAQLQLEAEQKINSVLVHLAKASPTAASPKGVEAMIAWDMNSFSQSMLKIHQYGETLLKTNQDSFQREEALHEQIRQLTELLTHTEEQLEAQTQSVPARSASTATGAPAPAAASADPDIIAQYQEELRGLQELIESHETKLLQAAEYIAYQTTSLEGLQAEVEDYKAHSQISLLLTISQTSVSPESGDTAVWKIVANSSQSPIDFFTNSPLALPRPKPGKICRFVLRQQLFHSSTLGAMLLQHAPGSSQPSRDSVLTVGDEAGRLFVTAVFRVLFRGLGV